MRVAPFPEPPTVQITSATAATDLLHVVVTFTQPVTTINDGFDVGGVLPIDHQIDDNIVTWEYDELITVGSTWDASTVAGFYENDGTLIAPFTGIVGATMSATRLTPQSVATEVPSGAPAKFIMRRPKRQGPRSAASDDRPDP